MSAVDETKYGRLLAEALPAIIETKKDNERALAIIERLMEKGEGNLSPEESTLFRLVVHLIEDYEEKAFPQVGKTATPRDVLALLMEQKGLKRKDLAGIFGSTGTISQVLNGTRQISKAQAKALSEFFKVPADLFNLDESNKMIKG